MIMMDVDAPATVAVDVDAKWARLKATVDDIQERVARLKAYDRTDEINAYCDDLECQIILAVESVVKSLDSIQDEWLKEISSYRLGLLRADKPSELDPDQVKAIPARHSDEELATTSRHLDELVAQAEAFRVKWSTVQTDGVGLSDEKAALGQNEGSTLNARIRELERQVRAQAFRGHFLRFDENLMFALDKELIGKLRMFEEEPRGPIGSKELQLDLVNTMTGHEKYIIAIQFLADGTLASCAADKSLRIWNVEKGELLHNLRVDNNDMVSLALLPNGHLASGTRDAVIKIWDLSKPKVVKVLNGHSRMIVSLEVLRNGQLASLSADGTIKIWNPYLNNQRTHILTICYSDYSLIVCAFGQLSYGFLVTVAIDEHHDVLKVWDPKDGRLVRQVKTFLDRVIFMLVLSNDNVVLASRNGTVHIYNLIEQTLLQTLEVGNDSHQFLSLVQLSNGYLLGARSRNCTEILVWNPDTGQLIQRINSQHQVAAMSVTRDGRKIATGSTDGSAKTWLIRA